MLRTLSIACLLIAAGVAWLLYGDRSSPMALWAVELDGKVPGPMWWIPLAVAVVAGLAPRPSSGSSARVSRPRTAPPPLAEPLPQGNWLQEVQRRAASLTLESGALLTLDLEGPVPFELHLTRMPPQRARRAVEQFVQFLATVPTPARARVLYQDCPAPTVPRAKAVAGSLRLTFPPDHVRAVGTEDRVDLLFVKADPRWALLASAQDVSQS